MADQAAQTTTPDTLADPTVNTVSETQAHGGEHSGGFPPFKAQTFPSQLLWLVISFGLLYVLLSRIALPRIATVLEDRRDRIADDLDQAALLKRQADEAIAAYELALTQARARAHAIAQETRDQLHAEVEKTRHGLESKLSAKTAEAEAQITATKDKALGNVRLVAIDVAGEVVARLLGEKADAVATEKAVDAELSANPTGGR
ncbi:MAG: F0F1 ATP synthase subunit B [Parvibaculaceae bacterium]|nr:F0F1 ATP synthase subunit B [Parvibaculaceae bacterium]